MAKAIITYGIDIDKSTGAPGSQGALRTLPAAILPKLRSILDVRRFISPLHPTSLNATQPNHLPERQFVTTGAWMSARTRTMTAEKDA